MTAGVWEFMDPVSTPALAEITRTHRELAATGLTRRHLIINPVLPAPTDNTDSLATAIHLRERAAIASLSAERRNPPLDQVELKATNMLSIDPAEATRSYRDHVMTNRSLTWAVASLVSDPNRWLRPYCETYSALLYLSASPHSPSIRGALKESATSPHLRENHPHRAKGAESRSCRKSRGFEPTCRPRWLF